MANEAAWIPAAKANVILDDSTEIPKPGPDEVLVKVRCIAFSPIDSKIQKYVTTLAVSLVQELRWKLAAAITPAQSHQC